MRDHVVWNELSPLLASGRDTRILLVGQLSTALQIDFSPTFLATLQIMLPNAQQRADGRRKPRLEKVAALPAAALGRARNGQLVERAAGRWSR
jgi:hypothetical protein